MADRLSLAEMEGLLALAIQNDTVDQWCLLALEWMKAAEEDGLTDNRDVSSRYDMSLHHKCMPEPFKED